MYKGTSGGPHSGTGCTPNLALRSVGRWPEGPLLKDATRTGSGRSAGKWIGTTSSASGTSGLRDAALAIAPGVRTATGVGSWKTTRRRPVFSPPTEDGREERWAAHVCGRGRPLCPAFPCTAPDGPLQPSARRPRLTDHQGGAVCPGACSASSPHSSSSSSPPAAPGRPPPPPLLRWLPHGAGAFLPVPDRASVV